ncbi:MAG TPA: hypothetical protein VEW71_06390 [Allosphingosinicella sp.]|nr:hypothetical protein [Allosphingosinicella sp.]
MKLLSRALLAAGLAALGACGGGTENVAANTANTLDNGVGDEVYNVAPDDLGAGNTLGNESLGNEADAGNATENASENAQ